MATANNRFTYIDGETVDVTVTMFDRLEAEKYATANGWGTINDSAIRQTAFACYRAARQAGKNRDLNFDDWSKQITSIDQVEASDQGEALAN